MRNPPPTPPPEGGRHAAPPNLARLRKKQKAVETFNAIFENTPPQRSLGQNIKKFEIPRPTPDPRQLQTSALNDDCQLTLPTFILLADENLQSYEW